MFFIEYGIIVFFGLVLGSFASMLTYRVPRGIPWSFWQGKKDGMPAQRSACPQCKTILKTADLVPIFSWVFLEGRCRHCKEPIPPVYPLVELAVLIGCIGIYAATEFRTPVGGAMMVIMPFLVALAAIDIERMILPNQLVLIVGAVGLFRLFLEVEPNGLMSLETVLIQHGLGAVVYAAFSWFLGWIMSKTLKKEALGFGDVKFFAVAGLWLGLSNLGWFCLLSGILGVVFALIWQALVKEKLFPFGPALIVSLYVLLLLQGSHFL